jgi:diphthine synthase
MLYIIGLGLGDASDISVKGLDIVKKVEKVYLEEYTSKLQCGVEELEKFYGRKVIKAKRSDIENKCTEILEEAKSKDIAILIIGSPTAATTHISFLEEARKTNTPVKFIENASVLTAIGITGLSLYKFGKTITIPFDNANVESVWDSYVANEKIGLHTLFLLDIQEDKLMTCREALDYLISKGLNSEMKVVACSALGSDEQQIKYGKASEVLVENLPQCLIIPSELNFFEEEILNLYK